MKAILIAGLGFGDEGKGTITQFLAQEEGSSLVVRYNGGAQAAHNVVTEDGRHHTFAQFGSATLEGARTHLSRFMLVEPHALLAEGRHLVSLGIADPYGLLTIDRNALLITPYHWSANRIREIKRGAAKHGSCGMGIGEAMSDSLTDGEVNTPVMADLEDPARLAKKLKYIQDKKVAEFEKDVLDISLPDAAHRAMKRLLDPVNRVVENYSGLTDILSLVGDGFLKHAFDETESAIFEGAQGVLLDQDFGFHPYTTWTNTTFENALTLLKDAGSDPELRKIGVIRTYMTRHGAGPLPTEVGVDRVLDRHNGLGLWQGGFRAGYFDIPLVKYGLDILGGVDEIALTHADQQEEFSHIAFSYRAADDEHEKFLTGNPEFGPRFLAPRGRIDLPYQEALTTALLNKKIHPQYTGQPTSLRDFIRTITEAFYTKISIVSEGPCLGDKYYAQ